MITIRKMNNKNISPQILILRDRGVQIYILQVNKIKEVIHNAENN